MLKEKLTKIVNVSLVSCVMKLKKKVFKDFLRVYLEIVFCSVFIKLK